ncbi:MAG: GNAT family N-acetyltransferase [Lachnospiraceae bacterium]|nr:GNAT family N-acetyltransferase [Lachnospiraceae bacterium]
MQAELREIDDRNIEECIALRVTAEQAQYIASNKDSLRDSTDNLKVARPFAIYVDDRIVGFTMFAFDEDYDDPNDRYWLWRFMIDKDLQGKGYGCAALKAVIDYFKNQNVGYIKLSTKASNVQAISLYHKFGFRENGEMNDEEVVLRLDL